MKKKIALLLTTTLITATAMLAGCGSTKDTTSVEDNKEVTAEATDTTVEVETEVETETEEVAESTVEPHEHEYVDAIEENDLCSYYGIHDSEVRDENGILIGKQFTCTYEGCDEKSDIVPNHRCRFTQIDWNHDDTGEFYYMIVNNDLESYYHNVVRNNDGTDDTDGTMLISCVGNDECPVKKLITDHDWGEMAIVYYSYDNYFKGQVACNKCGTIRNFELPDEVEAGLTVEDADIVY
jgi:hypothetical protein